MPSFRDLSEVAAHLSNNELPFDWYIMGPEGNAIQFEVAPRDCGAARQYFTEHPVELADGTQVPIHVTSLRGASWVSPPREGAGSPSEGFVDDSLAGLDVDEATTRANAAGWLVRAHEPEAVLTADFNPGRLNLCYGDDRRVQSVHRG